MIRTMTRAATARPALSLGSALFALSLALSAPGALAQDGTQDGETIITSHGVSSFGELKYPEGFPHFDYVNPEAPKGGEMSTWAFGTFDSLTPYILKGNAAAMSTAFYDSLLTGTLDEPDSMYGLVAESVEYPESREWIIFHMRPEATFRDGTPVTAEAVATELQLQQGRVVALHPVQGIALTGGATKL